MTADTPSQPTEKLEAVLDHFVYRNEDDGWSVVRLSVPGRQKTVTAVGNFLGVQPGESLKLTGTWVRDPKYGRQFKTASFQSVLPGTLEGIEKYLGSGLIKGIGKVMAERLVKHFGQRTLEVIERKSKRLTEVEGIGKVRARLIRESWSEQREIKDVMIFLQSYSVSTAFAIRIYKKYGNDSVRLVRDNPYRLATDFHGIGFKTADRIAASLGVEPASPQRAEAGTLYSLGQASEEGHVFVPAKDLISHTAEMLGVAEEVVDCAVEAASAGNDSRLVVEQGVLADDDAVFLRPLHAREAWAAKLLRHLLETPVTPIAIDVPKALAWFEERQKIELAEKQREAISRALTGKVLVITGGPGTGKTTLVKAVISILEKKGRRILLCAPTGRAAQRMQEATGREAKTVHRMLKFNPRNFGFDHGQDNPLEADVLIVDEVSMVDISLFQSILAALPPWCQLILVGDMDQLPSVGPGSVLRDLIRSGAVEVARLTEIFRQARESSIVVNAHLINKGQVPNLELAGDDLDFFFIERDEPEEALATILQLVARRIPQRFHLDPVDDIQVLSPMHRGTIGTANLNSELQQLLNPEGVTVGTGAKGFRIGDKVMQVRNNYDLNVYNGDIGRIVMVDEKAREVSVRFDSRLVRYDALDLDELMLAYACSVHKSQGSEYPAVVIPIHTQHYLMLQRNLLYTGITRGKKLVVLVGSRRAVTLAVKNDRIRKRHTRLAERLRG